MSDERTAYFDALVAHETDLWNAIERRLRMVPGSVGLARLETLRTVRTGAGQARVQDIVNRQRITVGAASRLVDRLIDDDLLARAPNPSDGRSSVLVLTDHGTVTLAVSEGAFADAMAAVFAGIDPAELARVTASLRRLRAWVNDSPDT